MMLLAGELATVGELIGLWDHFFNTEVHLFETKLDWVEWDDTGG